MLPSMNTTKKIKYAVRHPSQFDGAICETQSLARAEAVANAAQKRRMGGYVVAVMSSGLRVKIS